MIKNPARNLPRNHPNKDGGFAGKKTPKGNND
jgi:hypothetical protein